MKNKRRHNTLVIKKIANQYQCSERYVRGCIIGQYTSLKSDAIRNDYKVMDKAIKEAIVEIINPK